MTEYIISTTWRTWIQLHIEKTLKTNCEHSLLLLSDNKNDTYEEINEKCVSSLKYNMNVG